MAFRYDPTIGNFTTFESVPIKEVKITMPVMPESIDYTSNGFESITEDNIPIAEDTLKIDFNSNHIDNPYVPGQYINYQSYKTNNHSKVNINNKKGSEELSSLIDEVSNEEEFKGLKDPEIKQILMLQAYRESRFNPMAQAKDSTASGYFQFIDGTRKQFSSVSKKQFMNDPKEQIRTAYKYYNWIHSLPNAKLLSQRGYNNAQITALGWWYPDSMRMVLNGNKNFSKGGYSIKQALETYS